MYDTIASPVIELPVGVTLETLDDFVAGKESGF